MSSSPASADDLQTQLQNMWRTRPARATTGSTIGGVCTGIGARYKVDPTLVKVAFIVAALFGGSGIVLYIAAWIVLPEGSVAPQSTGPRRHRWHGFRHSSSHPPTVAAVVVLVIVALILQPNHAWGGGGLAGVALMLLGWWLLHQRTPTPDPGTSADTLGQRSGAPRFGSQNPAESGSWWRGGAGTEASADTPEQFERWTPRAWLKDEPVTTAGDDPASTNTNATAADPPPPSPPSWDPLGVAPFAWDLPEPTLPDDTETHSSRFTPVVLGLAIIATAVSAAVAGVVGGMSPAQVASVGLAVLSVGLLIGAFTRRGVGLITFAIPVAGFVVVASVINGIGFPSGPVGDRDWKPLTTADLQPEYRLSMGNGTLDLTNIDLTEDKTVTTKVGAGEFKVIAPAGMNVRAKCDVSVGEVKCPDGLDGGNDGTEGPVLTLDMSATLGNLEVTRE